MRDQLWEFGFCDDFIDWFANTYTYEEYLQMPFSMMEQTNLAYIAGMTRGFDEGQKFADKYDLVF